MKISHYMTIDRGSGPVSFVVFNENGNERMVRVTHRANFDRVKETDFEATKKALIGEDNLRDATTKVPVELRENLSQEIMRWAAANTDMQHGALRWDEDGKGIFFPSENEAVTWEIGIQKNEPTPKPQRRKKIFG